MAATFVTTLDNPYDYWTEFDEWLAFDTSKGYDAIGQPYNTLNYMARVMDELHPVNSDMPPEEYEAAVSEAVDEILRMNITGNYVKTVEGVGRVSEH